ncbi:MAG: hypothetical protein KKA68_20965 [Gammaproteobacteria bacterium]|nr:hypothetical protein [Gammaproteobacteria bacterium]
MWLNDDVRFCFTVFEDNEQYETGDTLIHTFWKTSWDVCTTKWCYFFASISGLFSVSTSPIFEYHNDGVDPVPVPPPPPTMRVPILGGSIYTPDNALCQFNPLHGQHVWNTSPWYQLIPCSGKLSHLLVANVGSVNLCKATTVSIYKNGARTLLSTYLVDELEKNEDTQHELSLVDGDLVSVRNIPCCAPLLNATKYSCLFTPDDPNTGILLGCTQFVAGGSFNKAFTTYAAIATGGARQNGLEGTTQQPMPTTGKLTYCRITLSQAPDPGGLSGYRCMLRKNLADTGMFIDFIGNTVTSTSTIDIPFVAGDLFNWKISPIGAPANEPYASWGFVYMPDIIGESIILGMTSDLLHQTTTEQNTLTHWSIAPWKTFNAATYDMENILWSMTLKKFAVHLYLPPGIGDSFTFTLYNRAWLAVGGDTLLEVQISDNDTYGYNSVDSVVISDYNCARMKCNPSGSPALTRCTWGLVAYMPQPL